MNSADRVGFYIHVPRDSGRLYIGQPKKVYTVGGRVLMGLSRRINHSDGSFAGVVSLQMNPDRFTDFYRSDDLWVGKACGSTCRSRWSPYNSQNNKQTKQ